MLVNTAAQLVFHFLMETALQDFIVQKVRPSLLLSTMNVNQVTTAHLEVNDITLVPEALTNQIKLLTTALCVLPVFIVIPTITPIYTLMTG